MRKKKKRKKIVNYKRFAVVSITFVMLTLALIFGYFYYYLSSFSDNSVDLSKKGLTSTLDKDEVEQGLVGDSGAN